LTEIFRSSDLEPLQVYDYQISFTSSNFAPFLNLFIKANDSLVFALLKIQIVKALLVAYLLTFVYFLVVRFPEVRKLGAETFICVFAFPYTIFMASSVYTASIATIALVAVLMILRVFETESFLPTKIFWTLVGHFIVASALIMLNRFETTVFYAIAISLFCLKVWRRVGSWSYLRVLVPSFAILLLISLTTNKTLRLWVEKVLKQDAKILNVETANSSVVVEQIGDVGLSVTAPLTFFDNSSRNLLGALGTSSAAAKFLNYLLLLASWTPLICLILFKLLQIFRPMFLSPGMWRRFLTQRYSVIIILFLFLFVPYFARTIWFLHYAIPLLCVLLFFSEGSDLGPKLIKILCGLGAISNVLVFFRVTLRNGTLYFDRLAIGTSWQLVIATAAGLCLLLTTLPMWARSDKELRTD